MQPEPHTPRANPDEPAVATAASRASRRTRLAASPWTTRAVLLAAYLLGAWRWAAFFGYGRPQLMVHMDWSRVGFYFAAVEEALRTRALPLYYPLGLDGEWVNFYWAHPDTPLLPHILLLRFLPPAQFILLTVLAAYTAGFLGVLALARRYGLTLVPTLLLELLLLGNGYLVGHLSAGHMAWIACFLMPWWCYYTWALADGDPIPGSSLKLAAVLAITLLDGATHLALWCWMVLAVLALTQPRAFGVVARAACWFVLFTAIRLVPTLTVFPLEVVTHFAWMGGYDWPLLRAAVLGGQPAIVQYQPFQWEYDAYLGAPAAAFLIVFGLIAPFFLPGRGRHLRLLAAAAFFVFAMCGDSMVRLRNNPMIPIIGGERMPTRMVIMPIVVLAVQACWALQRILERLRGSTRRVVMATAIGVLCATALLFDGYAYHLTPRTTGVLIVPPPHLPSSPTGSGWGTMPIAAVSFDINDPKHALTFNMIYTQAIKIGTLITCAAIVLAVATRRRRSFG